MLVDRIVKSRLDSLEFERVPVSQKIPTRGAVELSTRSTLTEKFT
jgi:hypothetical protein